MTDDEALESEGRRQKASAVPSPPVYLQWHCGEIAMTVALATLFSDKGIDIVPIYTPNPYHTDPFSDYISD